MAVAPTQAKLDPEAIKKVAEVIPGCREVPAELPTVLSFLVDGAAPARVNVYIDTGTIATCRVLNGVVRQTFRRNVTSLDVVQHTLEDPPTLMTIDNRLVADTTYSSTINNEGSDVDESTRALRSKMELAEVGVCILMGEKERLDSHLEALQDKEEVKDYGDTEMSGIEFEFSLPPEGMKHVELCLKDIRRQDKPVTCVATNGRGTVFLYGNGGIAFTPNIPKVLFSKLKLKGTAHSIESRPCYVSLGSRDRFYIGFNDGTADWKGPKAFDKCMRKLTMGAKQEKREAKKPHTKPRSVAFGSNFDSFFVVFHDGSWEYNGRGIPEELKDKLEDRSDRPDLVCVTLGPKGEWFVKVENGRMWWGGISEALDKLIQGLLESDRFLSFMDFGENGTFFVSYD